MSNNTMPRAVQVLTDSQGESLEACLPCQRSSNTSRKSTQHTHHLDGALERLLMSKGLPWEGIPSGKIRSLTTNASLLLTWGRCFFGAVATIWLGNLLGRKRTIMVGSKSGPIVGRTLNDLKSRQAIPIDWIPTWPCRLTETLLTFCHLSRLNHGNRRGHSMLVL